MNSLQKRQKASCGSWKLSSVYEWKLKRLWLHFSLTHGWLWKTGLGITFPVGSDHEHDDLICIQKETLWDKTVWRPTDSAQWLGWRKMGYWGQRVLERIHADGTMEVGRKHVSIYHGKDISFPSEPIRFLNQLASASLWQLPLPCSHTRLVNRGAILQRMEGMWKSTGMHWHSTKFLLLLCWGTSKLPA